MEEESNVNKPVEKKENVGETPKKPVVCIITGMAGSGKTTLLQRIYSECYKKKKGMFTINLDPAVPSVPFGCNIDIRKTVNYSQVMKHYKLGPNGAILTCLNLFSTKFDQVVNLVEKRVNSKKKKKKVEYVFVDTPGQIEIFTWSASGQIITECLSSRFPCCILYVVDTPRTKNPITFMSNMLYACSILYKFKLPFILVFNKTDHTKHEFAVEWMKDFMKYNEALKKEKSYSSNLAFSMSLVLEEFYENLATCGVSAITGKGIGDLFEKIEGTRKEYYEFFYKDLMEMKKKKKKILKEEKEKNQNLQKGKSDAKKEKKEEDLSKLKKDLKDETKVFFKK